METEMTNLPPVVDQYDDNGLLLRAICSGKVPALVKMGADMSSPNQRYAEDYALVVDGPFGREYKLPCVDAGNTLASAMYFAKVGHLLPEQVRREAGAKIREALLEFGFTPPAELDKTASSAESLDDIIGGQAAADDLALRRLFGADEDSAFSELKDEFAGLSPRGKRRLAMQVKEAGAIDAAPEEVQVYARTSFGTDTDFGLDARATLAPESDIGVLRVKVAAARHRGDTDAAAEAIYKFDVENRLTAYYGRTLRDPYASVLGNEIGTTVEKVASSHLEIDGRTLSHDDVRAFSLTGSDKLTDVFGEEFTAQFSSDPVAVFDSLPTPHKKAIARMMDEPRS